MNESKISRWVRGYDRTSENLVVEYLLPDAWDLVRLQELFGVTTGDPMFDCFPAPLLLALTRRESGAYVG
ncbi:MAG: hypothetical protein RL033_5477 [Pseudomonadota bacterium]|jgi:hypothetical protein